MNRREFLKTTAVLAALGAVTKLTGGLHGAEKKTASPVSKTDGAPDIVAVRGGKPADMFDRAMKELGGMEKFVKKGQVVTVKPNIAWDQPPEMAANTNPELVAKIVSACYAAGASKVRVFDTTCNDWRNTYKNSGIRAAAEKAGAEVIGGDSAHDPAYLSKYYKKTKVTKGRFLKEVDLHKLILDCDVLINVPILKVHGGAVMTCCLKNLMGTVSKRCHQLFHKSLSRSIAECASIRPPDLNIVDAYRVMINHGPRGVNQNDVRQLGYLLAGKDMVALDTASAKLMGLPLSRIKYIPEAVSLGLGTTDLKSLNIKRIKM